MAILSADDLSKLSDEDLDAFEKQQADDTAAEAKAHRRLCRQLNYKFTNELGKRGQKWELVNEDNSCGVGPICIKLGDPAKHKAWQAKGGGTSHEDLEEYVIDSVVYPERSAFLAITFSHPEIRGRVAIAQTTLFGWNAGQQKGKF